MADRWDLAASLLARGMAVIQDIRKDQTTDLPDCLPHLDGGAIAIKVV